MKKIIRKNTFFNDYNPALGISLYIIVEFKFEAIKKESHI